MASSAARVPSAEHRLPLLGGVASAGGMDAAAVDAARARAASRWPSPLPAGRDHGRAVSEDNGARRRAPPRRQWAGEGPPGVRAPEAIASLVDQFCRSGPAFSTEPSLFTQRGKSGLELQLSFRRSI